MDYDRKLLVDRLSVVCHIAKQKAQKCISSIDDDVLDYYWNESLDDLVRALYKRDIEEKRNTSLARKYSFIKEHLNKAWLDANFRVIQEMSDSEITVYSRRFPVYSYGSDCMLEGELRIYFPECRVEVNCYDRGSKGWYAAFYSTDYGRSEEILRIIENKIKREFKKIGLKM